MSPTSAPASGIYRRKRLIGICLALLGGLYCLLHIYLIRNSNPHFLGIDFRAVYSSSRCIVDGCNPYYFADLRTEFLKQGGSLQEALTPISGPFQPHYVGYPPPTLFYLVPFTLLRWPVAWFVYMAVAIGLYAIAVLLFADLCSEYEPIVAGACLGFFLAFQETIVVFGQPTLLAAALLCIGVWCLLKNRYPRLGVLSCAFSLVLKPHLGGLFLLYFLVATPAYRKRAWQVIGAAVILCLPALLWFSTHAATRNWVQDYKANLAGISAPGNLSDPGPQHPLENMIIDLQTVVSRYRDDPSFYNPVVYAFSAVVIAVWLYPALRRRPSQEKDILCLAAIAAFSMLPVYHRVYDSRALLILFPAIAVLLRRTVWWGWAATIITLFVSLVLTGWYTKRTDPVDHAVQSLASRPLLYLTVVHLAPFALLAVTIFYLTVLYVYPPGLAGEAEVVANRLEEPAYP